MSVTITYRDCSECHCVWYYTPAKMYKCSAEEKPMDLPDYPVIPDNCPLKK